MHIPDLIDRCAEITKSKGFDVTQHRTQLCLMATEIAEALECVGLSHDTDTDTDVYAWVMQNYARHYEFKRSTAKDHKDDSGIINMEGLLEELADVMIRVASYVGGNGWSDEFIKALTDKMAKNETRPHKHGKGF